MSRIVIEHQNRQDVHISIPNWLFKIITGLLFVWVVVAAAALLRAGSVESALLVLLFGLALIPLFLILTYIYWRIFWWLLLIQTLCASATLLPALIVALVSGRVTPQSLPVALPTLPGVSLPPEIIAAVAVLLVCAVLYLLLRRRPYRAAARQPADDDGLPADLDAPPLPGATLMDQVVSKMQRRGYETSTERDIVRVYKGRGLVALVKCVDRPGKPVAPMFIVDAERTGRAASARATYVAASGYFPDETRQAADRLGVRLLEL
jgi:hypothetical protein